MRLHNSIYTLLVLLALLMPLVSFGQTQDSTVAVSLFPSSPDAFEDVSITVSTFSFDLNRASITWKVDGNTKLQGIGRKSFTVKSGALGSTTLVDIAITVSTGKLITKQITIRPTSVDLLWEAIDSYVPPFYKGKALPTSETQIKVVALPSLSLGSSQIKSSDLVYNWKKNFQNIQNSSGFGRKSYTFKNDYLDDVETIGVEVSRLNQSSKGLGQVAIQLRSPQILFYEDSELEGTNYTFSLDRGFTPRTNQVTIVAEPFFFSSKNAVDSDFIYSWKLNNETTQTQSTKNVLSLQFDRDTGGVAEISLGIKSLSKLFQSDSSLFSMFLNR